MKNYKIIPSSIASTALILLPIIISLIALLHSTGVITKFKLEVFIDGYLYPKSSIPNDFASSFPIILPIIFNNTGNRSGVIEDVILEIKKTTTNEIHLYSPIVEVDLQKYINGKRALHAENIISPNFSPFSLNGNESCIKSILFTQDEGIKGFPGLPTKAGKYVICVLVKVAGKNYKREFEFNVDFNEKVINDYNNGSSIYNGRINFPYNDFKLPPK
ncbi:MAG: hypothetical protein WCG82_08170 [Bacteroidota bacterium]